MRKNKSGQEDPSLKDLIMKSLLGFLIIIFFKNSAADCYFQIELLHKVERCITEKPGRINDNHRGPSWKLVMDDAGHVTTHHHTTVTAGQANGNEREH